MAAKKAINVKPLRQRPLSLSLSGFGMKSVCAA